MRKTVGIILLLIFSTPLIAGQIVADKELAYRKDLASGAQFLRKKIYASAMGRFRAALNTKPESAEAYYWIGMTYSELTNYDLAARNAKNAVFHDERMTEAWLLWGQCLMYLKEWGEARKKLEQAHSLEPDSIVTTFNLGRCYYHGLNDPKKAYRLFKKVLELGQSLRTTSKMVSMVHQARLYMGYCYQAKKMWPEAIIAFRDVVKWDPDNKDATFRLGVAFRQANRFDEAERTLLPLVKEELNDKATLKERTLYMEACLQVGHLYLTGLHDKLKARYYLRRYLKYAPKDHNYREQTERFLEAKRNVSKKRKEVEEATPPPMPDSG